MGPASPYNRGMKIVYLSPHFDDAALSCGGVIWDQVQSGQEVEVWNIFAGNPPPGELSLYAQVHHKIWELTFDEVVPSRQKEDDAAMAVLGALSRNFDFPDAIYRKHPKTGEPMYTSREELFGGLNPGDEPIIRHLAAILAKLLPAGGIVVAPLTVGNHVDHQLVRIVSELLPVRVWYYPEFPYTREFLNEIQALIPRNYHSIISPVSQSGLAAWQESVAAYQSQISTFWSSTAEMRLELAQHAAKFGGVTFWRPQDQVG